MSHELGSLEERLYDYFYKSLEIDKRENGKFSKKMSRLGKYLRYVYGAGVVGVGSLLTYQLVNSDVSLGEFIIEGGACTGAAGLTIHMHNVKKIFEAIYRRNTGENLNKEEINKIKRDGKVGRYAHLCGATAMLASIGGLVMSHMINPKDLLLLVPVSALWYHYSIKKGYGALYSSIVDYAVGEKR